MAKINRIEPKVPALKKRQRVAAYGRDDVRFTFKNGMEIKA